MRVTPAQESECSSHIKRNRYASGTADTMHGGDVIQARWNKKSNTLLFKISGTFQQAQSKIVYARINLGIGPGLIAVLQGNSVIVVIQGGKGMHDHKNRLLRLIKK